MSDVTIDLRKPPIVEAVLDIECDFAPGSDFVAHQAQIRTALGEGYPTPRLQLMQSFLFEARAGEPVNHSTQQEIQAHQFVSADERQIVQIRASGYSFNRLAPYTKLDDYLPEIRRTWEIYKTILEPIQVRTIRLRYINRINLPLNANGRVDLDDYFIVGPRLPDEQGLSLASFLNQYLAVENETGYQVASVLTMQAMIDEVLPVIFDNTAAAAVAVDPGDWQSMEATIKGLRGLKNRVFKNTLTDTCLNLFQQ